MKYPEPAIFELLKNLAAGKVYAMRAPQGETGPCIVFQRTDSTRWRAINNPSGIAQVYLQIDSYATELYTSKDLAAEIETILDGYRGTVSYGTDSPQDFVEICGITLQNDTDFLDQSDEPLLFRNSATYLVTHKQ